MPLLFSNYSTVVSESEKASEVSNSRILSSGLALNQTDNKPKTLHKILLSPRSYYSKWILQEYDPELTTVAEYEDELNDDDELI